MSQTECCKQTIELLLYTLECCKQAVVLLIAAPECCKMNIELLITGLELFSKKVTFFAISDMQCYEIQ